MIVKPLGWPSRRHCCAIHTYIITGPRPFPIRLGTASSAHRTVGPGEHCGFGCRQNLCFHSLIRLRIACTSPVCRFYDAYSRDSPSLLATCSSECGRCMNYHGPHRGSMSGVHWRLTWNYDIPVVQSFDHSRGEETHEGRTREDSMG
jgi:hypothetical protein